MTELFDWSAPEARQWNGRLSLSLGSKCCGVFVLVKLQCYSIRCQAMASWFVACERTDVQLDVRIQWMAWLSCGIVGGEAWKPMLNYELGEVVCLRVLFSLIKFGKKSCKSMTDVCWNGYDGELDKLVVDASTGQRWCRSGVEADTETSVGWHC